MVIRLIGAKSRQLVAGIQRWAEEMGCSELASDALLDNTASHDMRHRGLRRLNEWFIF